MLWSSFMHVCWWAFRVIGILLLDHLNNLNLSFLEGDTTGSIVITNDSCSRYYACFKNNGYCFGWIKFHLIAINNHSWLYTLISANIGNDSWWVSIWSFCLSTCHHHSTFTLPFFLSAITNKHVEKIRMQLETMLGVWKCH